MNTKALLADIEQFLAETGMTEYRFGMLATKNGRLVERLRQGTTAKRGNPVQLLPSTEASVRNFIKLERMKRRAVA